MSGVILKPRFRNKPEYYTAQKVGPVGETHQRVKLRHSAPDLPLRFDDTFATARVGQNIQDGNTTSFMSRGKGAKTFELGFDRPGNDSVNGGFTVQNIVPEDRLVIPETVALPSYTWENQKAQVYHATVSGGRFLPLPGGFRPEGGSLLRGAQVPQNFADVETTGGVQDIHHQSEVLSKRPTFLNPAFSPPELLGGQGAGQGIPFERRFRDHDIAGRAALQSRHQARRMF